MDRRGKATSVYPPCQTVTRLFKTASDDNQHENFITLTYSTTTTQSLSSQRAFKEEDVSYVVSQSPYTNTAQRPIYFPLTHSQNRISAVLLLCSTRSHLQSFPLSYLFLICRKKIANCRVKLRTRKQHTRGRRVSILCLETLSVVCESRSWLHILMRDSER